MAAPELWLQARGNKTDGDIFTDMELYAKAKTDATNASERGVIDWLSDCVDAEALLKHWGLDPAGNLVEQRTTDGHTAMCHACGTGELGVARWLFAHGAAEQLRTPDSKGWTPMMWACFEGFLNISTWLFQMGAAEDIRTTDEAQQTPLYWASSRGHVEVVRWLCEVGNADDTKISNNLGVSPFIISIISGHRSVALLLLFHRAVSDATGHVDPTLLLPQCVHPNRLKRKKHFKRKKQNKNQDIRSPYWDILKSFLIDIKDNLIYQHYIFSGVVLPATRFGAEDVPPARRSTLRLLGGHEGLLRLINDFAGVERGRRLRIAREAVAVLTSTLDGLEPENSDDDSSSDYSDS